MNKKNLLLLSIIMALWTLLFLPLPCLMSATTNAPTRVVTMQSLSGDVFSVFGDLGGVTTNNASIINGGMTNYISLANGRIVYWRETPYLTKIWQGVSYTPTGGEFQVVGDTPIYDFSNKAVYLTSPQNVTNFNAHGSMTDGTLDLSSLVNLPGLDQSALGATALNRVVLPDNCSNVQYLAVASDQGAHEYDLKSIKFGKSVTLLDCACWCDYGLTNVEITGCANLNSIRLFKSYGAEGAGGKVWAKGASAYAINYFTNNGWTVITNGY